MKRNKMMACILALVLLMAAAPPLTASAAGSAALTVIPPPSLILTAGDFKAYKLFDVAVSGTAPDKNYAYTATAATDAFLSSTGPSFPFGSTSAAFMAYLENDPDMDDLNIALTAYAGDPGFHADFKKSAAQEPAPDEARVKFSGLDYGYYLIIGEGGATDSAGEATGERVVAYSALHTVEQANETIHLKADAPLIDKKIWNHNAGVSPLNPEDAGWMDWTDVNIGGGVDFKLRSRVPVMTGYKDYAFTVHDYMSRGLTFQSGSVKVTVGGEELAEDVDYEVSAASSIPNGDPRDNTGEEYKGG
ncbi:MAG: isopeptide-forming domain-containing fimbrial protein, partial [Oscillospiraceae bacterium]|nr:isopeptide-forming domain-containing fimbrial protein [Oscillospiraceae bacterium]